MTDHLKEFQFQKNQPKPEGSGRKLGTRNKLSERFLKDLHAEWERSGSDCLKILAKENPEAFARLALGVLPKEHEHEGLPPSVVVVNTGVVRAADTPAIPGPPAALPAPKKEPEAEACPLMTSDLVAPLPRADDVMRPAEPTKAEVREKLIYEKPVVRPGWR